MPTDVLNAKIHDLEEILIVRPYKLPSSVGDIAELCCVRQQIQPHCCALFL